jgi:hypothetical protein
MGKTIQFKDEARYFPTIAVIFLSSLVTFFCFDLKQ